jgi:hypothetical protein
MSKSPNRLLGVVFGVVYLLIGILGFVYTSGSTFFATANSNLLIGIFQINPFHNVAHLVIGAALLIAGLSNVRAAKAVNGTIGAAYLLLGIAGLFLVNSSANIFAINAADNVLHFASAAVLLIVALGADKTVRPPVAA